MQAGEIKNPISEMLLNHHTHSNYSDGNSHPEEYIRPAISLGFEFLGFTEHSPLPFDNGFSFKLAKKEEYLDLFRNLKSTYEGQIELALGMEFDFIPGISENFKHYREAFNLDYSIGSVHLVGKELLENLWFIDGPLAEIYDEGLKKFYGGDIRKAVTTYYNQVNEMLQTQEFEIIGHLDKIKMHNRGRYFNEEDGWYISLVAETLQLIKEKGTIVEINTRGIYKKRSDTTYPGPDILKELARLNIPVMVNSDAHQPHELNGAREIALELARDCGIREMVRFSERKWVTYSI